MEEAPLLGGLDAAFGRLVVAAQTVTNSVPARSNNVTGNTRELHNGRT